MNPSLNSKNEQEALESETKTTQTPTRTRIDGGYVTSLSPLSSSRSSVSSYATAADSTCAAASAATTMKNTSNGGNNNHDSHANKKDKNESDKNGMAVSSSSWYVLPSSPLSSLNNATRRRESSSHTRQTGENPAVAAMGDVEMKRVGAGGRGGCDSTPIHSNVTGGGGGNSSHLPPPIPVVVQSPSSCSSPRRDCSVSGKGRGGGSITTSGSERDGREDHDYYKGGVRLFSLPFFSSSSPQRRRSSGPRLRWKKSTIPLHLYVLPVMLLEFLAIAITRAVLPSLILQTFGDDVYFIMGCAECIRGLLAFIACPLFGKISDVAGRRPCLFVTVLGTCAPVCSLALMTYDYSDATGVGDGAYLPMIPPPIPQSKRIWAFVYLLALSGVFSSTFTLVFAYISDAIPSQKERVSAYGLALATFGLSFTVGPMMGGYLAQSWEVVEGMDDQVDLAVEEEREFVVAATTLDGEVYNEGEYEGSHADGISSSSSSSESPSGVGGSAYPVADPEGQTRVFTCALFLTIMDLLYIYFVLPESRPSSPATSSSGVDGGSRAEVEEDEEDYCDEEEEEDRSDGLNSFYSATKSLQERMEAWKEDVLPQSWTPLDALRVFSGDPFLAEIGRIAFLYYTGLWAVISTLVLYAAKRFHYGPERLGELMSAFGLCTMLAEAVLLRIAVPILGERRTMQLGLAAFAIQCAILGLAYDGWQLFLCVAFSMASNLVYPSLTSLVSRAVAPNSVGEALGAVNGVKALTEGIGPLIFGGLMTISEKSRLPGWPYLIAAVFAVLAYGRAQHLPRNLDSGDDEDDLTCYDHAHDYISEKYSGASNLSRREGRVHTLFTWLGRAGVGAAGGGWKKTKKKTFVNDDVNQGSKLHNIIHERDDDEDELRGLLSDQCEHDDEDEYQKKDVAGDAAIDGNDDDEKDGNDNNNKNIRKLQEMSFFSASL